MNNYVLSKLIRINRHWVHFCRNALAPYKYIGVMHLILIYINKYPGASQEEISAFYALDKTGVARDAQRLEEMGHIQRQTDPESRRRYKLYLTGDGKKMIDVINNIYSGFQNRLSECMSAEDWERLSALLECIDKSLV